MESGGCPVCYSNNVEPGRTISAAEAAQHFVLLEEDSKRNADLQRKIKRIWGRDDCQIRKCRNCDFGFAFPYRSGDSDFYKLAYPRSGYAKRKWEFDRTLREMKVLPLNGKRAIDVGAGEGFFLDLLKTICFETDSLWSTEYNASAAKQIERKGYHVFNGDIRDGFFDSGYLKFDFITLFQVLEHMDNLDALFARIKKISNPYAHVFIAVPNVKLLEYNERTRSLLDMPPNHIGRWSINAFNILAKRHGFTVKAYEVEPLIVSDFIIRDLGYSHLRNAQISGTLSNKCRSMGYGPVRKVLEAVCVLIGTPFRLKYWISALCGDHQLGSALWVHLTNK
jgi:SAM-dependent methyltransferase